MVPHLSSWYFSHVIAGAEAVSAEAGYDFLVIGVGSRAECSRLLDERLPPRAAHRRRGAGRTCRRATTRPNPSGRAASRSPRSAVYSPGYPSVRVDDFAVGVHGGAAPRRTRASTARVDHRAGRRPDELRGAAAASRRASSKGLADLGRQLDPSLVASGDFGIDGGQEAMALLLDHVEPPTAVFAHVRRDGLRCADGTRAVEAFDPASTCRSSASTTTSSPGWSH